jgi:hypothetical protein
LEATSWEKAVPALATRAQTATEARKRLRETGEDDIDFPQLEWTELEGEKLKI